MCVMVPTGIDGCADIRSHLESGSRAGPGGATSRPGRPATPGILSGWAWRPGRAAASAVSLFADIQARAPRQREDLVAPEPGPGAAGPVHGEVALLREVQDDAPRPPEEPGGLRGADEVGGA